MKKREGKTKTKVSIEAIEEMASKGEDVNQFFTGNAKWVEGAETVARVQKKDVQRVNVDFAQPMLEELDMICHDLNIPRQSLIKTMVRREMDRYLTNKKVRKA